MGFFFFNGIIDPVQPFEIDGEEAHHILSSRRIQLDEIISIQDRSSKRYLSKLISKSRRQVTLQVVEEESVPPEPELKIDLFQAVVKEKALDHIIQKTTELGVHRVILFESAYSQAVKGTFEKKLERWQRVAFEACKQCGRAKPPNILYFKSVDEALAVRQTKLNFMLDIPGEPIGKSLPITEDSQINLFIGPEGGWKKDELPKEGFMRLGLGPRILRADTAAISSIAIFQFLFGDLTAPC